jgi:large subunit ribosomal protein L29
MKTKELRGLADQDLILKEKSLKKELFDLYFQRKFGRVEKPGRFRQIKRDIARIKTLQIEREKDGAKKTQA